MQSSRKRKPVIGTWMDDSGRHHTRHAKGGAARLMVRQEAALRAQMARVAANTPEAREKARRKAVARKGRAEYFGFRRDRQLHYREPVFAAVDGTAVRRRKPR